MDIKAQASELYTTFQEAFVKYYYHQLRNEQQELTMDKAKLKITEKWDSFKNEDLKRVFVLFQKSKTLHGNI